MTVRSEVERVRRRIKSLERRRDHLGTLLANPDLEPHRRHWLEAEHSALFWVLGHIERTKQAAYDEAVRVDAERGWRRYVPATHSEGIPEVTP